MTKQQLAARVQELESQLPVAHPAMPVHIKAHETGAALRQHIVTTTQATKRGAVVAGSVTKGFLAGLFGK
jgi:hypothetical protein